MATDFNAARKQLHDAIIASVSKVVERQYTGQSLYAFAIAISNDFDDLLFYASTRELLARRLGAAGDSKAELTPVAPVKKPKGLPPSSEPRNLPVFRNRVRSTRQGSFALMRNSRVNLPWGAMSTAPAGACKYGFRTR